MKERGKGGGRRDERGGRGGRKEEGGRGEMSRNEYQIKKIKRGPWPNPLTTANPSSIPFMAFLHIT